MNASHGLSMAVARAFHMREKVPGLRINAKYNVS